MWKPPVYDPLPQLLKLKNRSNTVILVSVVLTLCLEPKESVSIVYYLWSLAMFLRIHDFMLNVVFNDLRPRQLPSFLEKPGNFFFLVPGNREPLGTHINLFQVSFA